MMSLSHMYILDASWLGCVRFLRRKCIRGMEWVIPAYERHEVNAYARALLKFENSPLYAAEYDEAVDVVNNW